MKPPTTAKPSTRTHETLEGFGFPRGILPAGVVAYTYRPSDGAFQVFLDRACEFEVEGRYRIKYKPVISGNVEAGSVRNLGGVSVRMFLLDWGIDRVVVAEDPGRLVFHVGPLSQSFPAGKFEKSPEYRSCQHSSWNGIAAMGDDGVVAM